MYQRFQSNPGQYILGEYGRKWYFGNIIEISAENMDAQVDFVRRSGRVAKPTLKSQQKGKCDDKYWVPFDNILMVINVPTAATSSVISFT